MKKSPLSTPGCHNGNFHHQNRARRGGYNYHQSRNNSSNDYSQRFSRPNNSFNNQFDNEVIPLGSSSPVFYHRRGHQKPMFDRRNQRFSNTGSFSNNDNQRNFQNNPDRPYHQRNPNQYRKKNEPHWHRQLPITEFVDFKSIFENPWAELERYTTHVQQSDSIATVDNVSVETIPKKEIVGDTLSDSASDEISTDIDNSRDELKDGSSVDLHLDGISFSSNSKDAST